MWGTFGEDSGKRGIDLFEEVVREKCKQNDTVGFGGMRNESFVPQDILDIANGVDSSYGPRLKSEHSGKHSRWGNNNDKFPMNGDRRNNYNRNDGKFNQGDRDNRSHGEYNRRGPSRVHIGNSKFSRNDRKQSGPNSRNWKDDSIYNTPNRIKSDSHGFDRSNGGDHRYNRSNGLNSHREDGSYVWHRDDKSFSDSHRSNRDTNRQSRSNGIYSGSDRSNATSSNLNKSTGLSSGPTSLSSSTEATVPVKNEHSSAYHGSTSSSGANHRQSLSTIQDLSYSERQDDDILTDFEPQTEHIPINYDEDLNLLNLASGATGNQSDFDLNQDQQPQNPSETTRAKKPKPKPQPRTKLDYSEAYDKMTPEEKKRMFLSRPKIFKTKKRTTKAAENGGKGSRKDRKSRVESSEDEDDEYSDVDETSGGREQRDSRGNERGIGRNEQDFDDYILGESAASGRRIHGDLEGFEDDIYGDNGAFEASFHDEAGTSGADIYSQSEVHENGYYHTEQDSDIIVHRPEKSSRSRSHRTDTIFEPRDNATSIGKPRIRNVSNRKAKKRVIYNEEEDHGEDDDVEVRSRKKDKKGHGEDERHGNEHKRKKSKDGNGNRGFYDSEGNNDDIPSTSHDIHNGEQVVVKEEVEDFNYNVLQPLIDTMNNLEVIDETDCDMYIPRVIRGRWEGPDDEENFPLKSTRHMIVKMKEALHDIPNSVNTLLIVEEALHCLNADLLEENGATTVCKMGSRFRPHYFAEALRQLKSNSIRKIKHVGITLAYNALFNYEMMENHEYADNGTTIIEDFNSKKSMPDLFNSIEGIVRALVEVFGLKKVLIITPHMVRHQALLKMITDKFKVTISKNNYLSKHVVYADFNDYVSDLDTKLTPHEVRQFLKQAFTAYGTAIKQAQ
ncbi:unnamed protein product [Bursaphelenchus okinawaensis]|uniref:Uncharacterized protein n=1 Tax=Bursaphelenchus okinawaensis TaxID=465554 RepID=A0A811KD48_9BILA|nr:unnamed protein product [Bursaphelenchus okinawaensis]CAG9101425.1 unnamed protein product [Bursaphelenchus okinawaensis]